MKRVFTVIIIACAMITSLYANQQGHFFLNVENENVAVSDVVNHFSLWLDLPANTTFTKFRDETDNLGIRHISYQQVVDGEDVDNGIVLTHAKNGIVYCVNGDIMDATIAAKKVSRKISSTKAARKVRKNSPKETDATLKIVRATIEGKEQYRYAYEVMAEDYTAKYFVDAETGDIIKIVPLVYNADVQGTAKTMYNGTQTITCYENNGYYYLMDEARGIITLNATFSQPINYNPPTSSWPDSIVQFAQQASVNPSDENAEKLRRMMQEYITTEYINGCAYYANTKSSWESSYYLTSVTITSANSDWWYSMTDATPDLYIEIYNSENTLVYRSEVKDDTNPPVTFDLPTPLYLWQDSYSIKIYDEDLTSDDYGGSVSIKNISIGKKSWSNTNTSGYVNIIGYANYDPAFSVHWGIEKTYDFYKTTFNRNSFDNNNHILYNLVNPQADEQNFSTMPNNAFAQHSHEPYFMAYGMGDNSYMYPVVGLEVMAHEYTHLVVAKNGSGGLEYLGESGALNESFADIMGIATQKYTLGSTLWLIGADVMVNASNMRSLKNPNNSEDGNSPQPDTYQGTYWANTTDNSEDGDHGGVHTNSGVQNYWFYLLSEGGSGTNDINNVYNVSGIGIDKAVQIAYRNLIYYLTPEATFEDSRNGSIQAAIDLYGKGSQEHQSVVNAWYAVGVGNAYSEYSDFTLTPGKYVIVANRNKSGDDNWYYMTSDLGTASNKRFQAITTGVADLDKVVAKDLESKYIWELEAYGSNWKLKNGSKYATWTSGNTANLAATGKSLTFDVTENQVQAHFNDGTAERYLSLNATTGTNYFAFYGNTNQVTNLYFIPYEEAQTPNPPKTESDNYVILAQRSGTTNWFYMTSDLGTASNKRYQAVDAGTSNLAAVATTGLDSKYYWQIEDNKLHTAAGYSTWTSGNTAI